MNKKVNKYEETSYSKPKEIESLNFFPMKEVQLKKVREKGKVYWWKLFGEIPIFPYKAKNDRYEDYNEIFLCHKPTFDELVFGAFNGKKYYVDYTEKRVFKLPYVRIKYKNDYGCNNQWFKTNEEAYAYCDKLAKEHKLEKDIH